MAAITEFRKRAKKKAADGAEEHSRIAVSVTLPPSPAPEPATPAAQAPEQPEPDVLGKVARKAGRPSDASRAAAPAEAEGSKFFDLVRSIPANDWDEKRAYIYVYITAPLCELNKSGGFKYLERSSKPILDFQGLMEAYGSFAGYMTLNWRAQGDTQTKLLDRLDFEIYNPKYPPKIPLDAWIKDSRNQKWMALLPKPEEVKRDSNEGVLETFFRIQDRIERRYERGAEEAIPPVDPVKQLAGVASVLQALKGESKSTDEGMRLFLTFMQDNAARQANAIDALQKELRDRLAAPPPAPPKDEFSEMVKNKLMARAIESLDKKPEEATAESDGTSEAPRGEKWWQRMIRDVVTELPNSPVGTNLSQALAIWVATQSQPQAQPAQPTHMPQSPAPSAPAAQPAAAIAPPPGVPQPQPQQQEQPRTVGAPMQITAQQMAPFVGQILEPLINHINHVDSEGRRDRDGWDLRQWFIDGRGMGPYQMLVSAGPETIMQAFRLSPFWKPNVEQSFPGLCSMEVPLKEFIEQFCTEPPPDDEGEGDDGEEPENLLAGQGA